MSGLGDDNGLRFGYAVLKMARAGMSEGQFGNPISEI